MAGKVELPPRLEVVLQNPNGYPGVSADAVGPWLTALVKELAPAATSLAVRLVGDSTIRELNREYRGIDRPTDVLSFPGERTPEGHHLGDIAISVPTARWQAGTLGHSLERELKCLLLHGVLHCLGHDHEADGGEMNRIELELRERWIGRPGESG